MRIAYLILCHTDPKHIGRLAEKLTKGTNNEVFAHVDKKSDILPFKQELKRLGQVAHVLEKRTSVFWGGNSAIEATVSLMREAVRVGDFDRFVLLQGLEYPIKSNKEIDEFFEHNKKTEFILAQNISDSTNPKEVHKYSLYWFLDSQNLLARILHVMNSRLFLKYNWIPRFKKNYVKDKFGHHMKIYQGCAQFGLTADMVRYIVQFHDENPKFNKYFKSMYAVDESYFHTIVYNSHFVKNTPDGKAVTRPHLTDFENLTYFEYPVTVTLFTKIEDWPRLRDSGFLYFRKASSESKELLDYIDEIHNKQYATLET